MSTYPFALSIVEGSEGVFTQSGGRNDIRYLRYGHEFRKFASVRQRFDAPNRIDNLIDVLLTQDRLHQPRRFLFDFFRAHGIFRTAAAVDDVFAQRLPVLQSDFNQSLKAVPERSISLSPTN